MKPTLILQPIHHSSTDMIRCFSQGKPLSSEQLHFLAWHEAELSNNALDPLIEYYITSEKKHRKYHGTFLLPHEILNKEDIEKLKKRIKLALKDDYSHIAIEMTEKQFLQFKEYTHLDLIFWAGNEFTSGARFYAGGVMPAIYFQWAEFFGVWKYAMIHENKKTRSNCLVYFEAMHTRSLNQCVDDYKKHLQEEMTLQHQIILKKQPTIQSDTNLKAPRPLLTNFYHIDPIEK